MIDYLDNTLDYLKNTLEGIKSGFIVVKDIVVSIGHVIGTIVDILGFIGFRVFILLITTSFIVWILNFVSPVSRKTNYFIAVGMVLWIGLTAKMPLQIVMLKYILIILSPFVITAVVNFLVKNANVGLKYIKNKLLVIFAGIECRFKKRIFKVKRSEKVGILFDCDLPTINEINAAKIKIRETFYEPAICCDEKISLIGSDNKVIFYDNLKYEQLIKSIKDKNVKILWFWGASFKDNGIVERLSKTRKIRQKKLIIGNSFNSEIFNFLQSKWNWKVIYGSNLKDCDKFYDFEDIIANQWQSMYLINDFEIQDGYFLKEKVVGGDFQSLINGLGTKSELNFKNKILFLDCVFASKNDFYKYIMHLKNFILDNKCYPKAIVMSKIIIQDGSGYSEIIEDFYSYLKANSACMPIFQCHNASYITLNEKHIINYNMSKINLI